MSRVAAACLCCVISIGLSKNAVVECELDIPFMPRSQYGNVADINLGGLFFISQYSEQFPCGKSLSYPTVVEYAEAMVFAIEEINKRTDILPNITLGYAILDDCLKASTALAQSIHFIPRTKIKGFGDEEKCEDSGIKSGIGAFLVPQSSYSLSLDVIGVIGPMSSEMALPVAQLLGVARIPQISPSATSDELSDKIKYPYFMRTAPADRFQAEAIVHILITYGWTYISIVNSEDNYGRNGAKQVKLLAKARGICVATSLEAGFLTTDEEFGDIVKGLYKYPKARVVVMFALPGTALGVLKAVKSQNISDHFIWIGSDTWSGHMNYIHRNVKPFSLGTFSLTAKRVLLPEFDEFFMTLTPERGTENPWFIQYWEAVFDCSFKAGTERPCNNSAALTNEQSPYRPNVFASVISDTVTTFAYGLDLTITEHCANVSKMELSACIRTNDLIGYMKNLTFEGKTGEVRYNEHGDMFGQYRIGQIILENGEVVHRIVGTYDVLTKYIDIKDTSVTWNHYIRDNENSTIPESTCSKPCQPGEIYIQRELPCCWGCFRCRLTDILTNNKTKCTPCPDMEWPDARSDYLICISIEPSYLRWSDPIAVVLVSLVTIGLMCVFAILIFFLYYTHNRLIKASSRELAYMMMAGIILGLMTVLVLIKRPSDWSCILAMIGFELGFSGIYAPLLTRTNRIYRIFRSSLHGTKRPVLISSRSQVLIAGALILFQGLLSCVTSILDPPSSKLNMPVSTEKHVERFCYLGQASLLSFLCYNMLLVGLCCYFAFKTRKLPDNFNESRFISMCAFTTFIIWLAFIPTYATTATAKNKTILLAIALILNDSVVLAFFFLPRVYGVMYVDDAHIQATIMSSAPVTSHLSGSRHTRSIRVAPANTVSTVESIIE